MCVVQSWHQQFGTVKCTWKEAKYKLKTTDCWTFFKISNPNIFLLICKDKRSYQ